MNRLIDFGRASEIAREGAGKLVTTVGNLPMRINGFDKVEDAARAFHGKAGTVLSAVGALPVPVEDFDNVEEAARLAHKKGYQFVTGVRVAASVATHPNLRKYAAGAVVERFRKKQNGHERAEDIANSAHIVFENGVGCGPRLTRQILAELRARGFECSTPQHCEAFIDNRIARRFAPRTCSVEKTAGHFAQHVDNVSLTTNKPDLVIVGYSKGAITICLADSKFPNRIVQMIKGRISDAGPFHGAPLAWAVPGVQLARELEPDSPLLASMQDDFSRLIYHAIVHTQDRTVPPESQIPLGFIDDQITYTDIGHHGSLFRPMGSENTVAMIVDAIIGAMRQMYDECPPPELEAEAA